MQHDYVISNDTGANVRADINNVLQAILTNNAGATQPSATQAGMFWGDISNASTYYLKIRNHTNDGWVSLYAYDVATKTISPVNTPAGNISSTTMQGAINELDSEKVAKITSTTNKLVKFSDTSSTITNSVIYDDGTSVGIGTSSPSDTIHISASSSDEKGITVSNSYAGGGSGAHYYLSSYDGTSTTVAGGILATNSTWTYHGYGANSTSFLGNHSGGTNIMATNAAGIIKFFTGGDNVANERMRIDSAGNVGIGTSSPSYKLHLSSDSAAKPSTNTWTISSDERLKENIELADLDRCYEIVKTIPLKRYTWKDSVYTQEQVSDRSKLGWIANDVQTVFPKAVNTHSQQLATFKIELKDVEEQKLISEAIVGQEEIKDEDGNIIQEFIEAKEAVYETITVQKEEKVYDVLDDCLDLNSDQIYAVMYGAIQKLQLTVESLTARIEALEAK